jgi:hypothetical protein
MNIGFPFYSPVSTMVSGTALPSLLNPYAYPLNQITVPGNSDLIAYVPRYPNVVAYQDINNDKVLVNRMCDYFHDKVLNNWLKFHYVELYKLLIVSGGKASLIKSINDMENNNKNDNHENAIKYEFLVANYFNRKDLMALLNKFRKMNGVNWWDLKKYTDEIRNYIHSKVKQYMRREIVG